MCLALAGPWTWYWVELVTIRWYQQRKVRVEAVIETHSRRQIASIFYKIYPLFLLNVLSRKWNVLWSDLGYYLKYYYHYYKTNHIFVSCSGCTSSSLTGSTCKENQGNKSLNFRGQNQKIGAKTRKQGKNLISLSAAPPVWHYGKVTSHSYYQAFKYCALQHYSPFFSPAAVLQRSRQWTMGGREVASCPAPAPLTGHLTTFYVVLQFSHRYTVQYLRAF